MTERNFSQALLRGLGSAIVHLKSTDNKAKYRDIVLRYCLRDISYDWQSEGTKGYYLYQAISALDDRESLEKIIIAKYSARCDDRLFRQLTDILSCCANDGSIIAKDALRAKYEYFRLKNGRLIKGRIDEGSRWEDVALSLYAIDGFSIFKQYATDMGELLNRNPNCRNTLYYDWFITRAEDTFGKKRVNAYIDKMYSKSISIKSLMDTIKADELSRGQYHKKYNKELITIEALIQAAKKAASDEINHYGAVMRLRRLFMNNASDAIVLEFANTILQEENETVKGLLLRIFWRKPFPLGATPLLEYAWSSNEILTENAIGLLEEFKDKRIHDLAIQLLETKGLDSLALGLLKRNYKKTDDVIIAKLVSKSSTIQHHVQQDIRDIYCHHRSANALPILLRVYRKGDCSFCRCDIVKAMNHGGVLSDEILTECLYDSYDDTRRFAKRLIEKRENR